MTEINTADTIVLLCLAAFAFFSVVCASAAAVRSNRRRRPPQLYLVRRDLARGHSARAAADVTRGPERKSLNTR